MINKWAYIWVGLYLGGGLIFGMRWVLVYVVGLYMHGGGLYIREGGAYSRRFTVYIMINYEKMPSI
jgi:hypothetical protein